jgi:hypothetical protein
MFSRKFDLYPSTFLAILYIQRLPQRSSDSAVTGPVGIHYDSVADSTPKQGGQSDHTIRRATSNMTQIDLPGTCHSHPIHRF